MILQGRFNSVFTPNSPHGLSTAKSLYLFDDLRGGGGGGGSEDQFPSAKTISIEHHCEKDYVGCEDLFLYLW